MSVYSSITHSSGKVEGTQTSVRRCVDDPNGVWPYNGILFVSEKDEVVLHTITGVNTEKVMLRGTQATCYLIPHPEKANPQRPTVDQWLPEAAARSRTSFWCRENVLKLSRDDCATLCVYRLNLIL